MSQIVRFRRSPSLLNPLLQIYSSHVQRNTGSLTIAEKIHQSFAYSVKIKVCNRFTKRPSILRPWFLRYIPKGGHEIEINYVDTMPDAHKYESVNTILILHGTPGSYYDYFKLLVTFGEKNRIIIPNFPDFNYTIKNDCFWHSAEEKSEFIMDFLKHLNVKNIDCLVAHSMAAYTASYLWIYAGLEDYFKLGSVCLLSPVGMYKFRRRHKIKLKLITNMCRSRLLSKLLPARLMNFYTLTPKGPSSTNFELSAWRALTLGLSNYEKYTLRLKMLAFKRIPTIVTFSSNDKLYSPNMYFDQLFELDINYDDYDIYEQYENELIQSSTDRSWIKAIDFRSAGHYMFNTHPDIIHSYIHELIERAHTVYLPKSEARN